jgi:hypothetical protein
VITPRLLRRSLQHALQWRLLVLWWASLALPGAIAALPVFRFLSSQLDHSTRARDAVAYLDGPTLLDLLRLLGEEGARHSIGLGLAGGGLTLLFVSPFVAGATVAAARSDEPLPLQRLLAGAGELYGRMLRTTLCGLLPLGIGGALAAGAMKLAIKVTERDLTETAADAHLRNGVIASAIAIFLAHLLVDAARAQFAAEPTRRSALAALWSAARLVVRRPLRALGVGAVGIAAGVGAAGLLMIVRLRIDQGGPAAIGAAWLLAQMAQIAVGWGRAARIFGLADLSRADAAERARTFRLEPPTTSPPPLLQTETPLPAAPLSPTGASGT